MSSRFAIAYTDRDGRGYSETEPWILDDFGLDIRKCLETALQMQSEGYQNVVAFCIGKKKMEQYSWKYVMRNRISGYSVKPGISFDEILREMLRDEEFRREYKKLRNRRIEG